MTKEKLLEAAATSAGAVGGTVRVLKTVLLKTWIAAYGAGDCHLACLSLECLGNVRQLERDMMREATDLLNMLNKNHPDNGWLLHQETCKITDRTRRLKDEQSGMTPGQANGKQQDRIRQHVMRAEHAKVVKKRESRGPSRPPPLTGERAEEQRIANTRRRSITKRRNGTWKIV